MASAPMTKAQPTRPVAAALGAGSLIVAGFALAFPLIEKWEGTHLVPYRDIVGVMTVCTGETRVPMRRYTQEECRAMLERAIRGTYGSAALACVPALARRSHMLAASISLAYNIGTTAFCGSTAARRFNTGDWRGGCDAFLLWTRAGGRIVQGLVNRRREERALCIRDVG